MDGKWKLHMECSVPVAIIGFFANFVISPSSLDKPAVCVRVVIIYILLVINRKGKLHVVCVVQGVFINFAAQFAARQ